MIETSWNLIVISTNVFLLGISDMKGESFCLEKNRKVKRHRCAN